MPTIQPTHPDAALSAQEHALLEGELAGAPPRLLLQTQTRVDTGGWLRRSALWLCLTDDTVILFAVGKRRYIQRVPITDCQGTHHCPASGALLLQPHDAWRFNTIHLPPTDARLVLTQLEADPAQTTRTPQTEPTGA